MNHRNTPDPEWKLSPAQLIYGRPIRDFLPIKLNQYSPQECWIQDRDSRELAMRHRIHLGMEKWSAKTRKLPALKVGQHVNIQNQHGSGKVSKRWDRTGVVVEDLGFDKYRIRVDGSGRVTDRNRRFLRLFKPATFTYLPGLAPHTPNRAANVPVNKPSVISEENEQVCDAPMTNPLDTAATMDTQTPMPSQQLATIPGLPSRSQSTPTSTQTTGIQPTPTLSMDSQPQSLDTVPTTSSPNTARETPAPHSPVRRSTRVRRPNQLYDPNIFDLSKD